jgi:hypothetical protein
MHSPCLFGKRSAPENPARLPGGLVLFLAGGPEEVLEFRQVGVRFLRVLFSRGGIHVHGIDEIFAASAWYSGLSTTLFIAAENLSTFSFGVAFGIP